MKPTLFLALTALWMGCGERSNGLVVSPQRTVAMPPNGLPHVHRKGPVPGRLTVHIVVRRVARLGTVLVDGKGRTFYAFTLDARRTVTCAGKCASVWRLFTLSGAQALDTSPELSEKLLGGFRDREGHLVVTFSRWPLYTYRGDTHPGMAKGEGLHSFGGRWYAVSPSGTLVKSMR